MKTVKIVPKICQDTKGEAGEVIPSKMKGFVVLRPPNFDERYSYIEQAGFEFDDKGTISASAKQLGSLRKMVALSKDHYQEVAIELEDGEKITSFEGLKEYSSCDPILFEVASLMMMGFSPSKK